MPPRQTSRPVCVLDVDFGGRGGDPLLHSWGIVDVEFPLSVTCTILRLEVAAAYTWLDLSPCEVNDEPAHPGVP